MFGDDLLVAPVTEPDVKEWTLYLPGLDQVKVKINGNHYITGCTNPDFDPISSNPCYKLD